MRDRKGINPDVNGGTGMNREEKNYNHDILCEEKFIFNEWKKYQNKI